MNSSEPSESAWPRHHSDALDEHFEKLLNRAFFTREYYLREYFNEPFKELCVFSLHEIIAEYRSQMKADPAYVFVPTSFNRYLQSLPQDLIGEEYPQIQIIPIDYFPTDKILATAHDIRRGTDPDVIII